jgi:hypothetical protein
LLRVSSAAQVDISRTQTNAPVTNTPVKGVLNIAHGSIIEAGESILLDASVDTQIDGQLLMQGGSLNLSASRISLGGVGTTGLSLTGNDFASLSLNELVLTSRSSVDIYGGFMQSFDRLRINAAALDGYGTDTSSLTATELVLLNTAGASADNLVDHSYTGTGDLSLNAQSISLQRGDFKIRGFNTLNMNVANDLTMAANGSLTLDVAEGITLDAGRLTAENGVNYILDAGNSALSLLNSTTSADIDRAVGARVSIKAEQIVHAGFIDLASGVLNMQANGAGASANLQLIDGSVINMSGIEQKFADVSVYSSGGVVKLTAKHGSVNMATQALIDVSGGAGQGRAGAVRLK